MLVCYRYWLRCVGTVSYTHLGVPNAIVPDNLKSAVTKPGGIEPVINDDFAAFADHYGCVVFPARVRKPKDKALVENAVRLLYREVYSKMTGLKCNDLEALNIEIMKHTDALNSRKMYNRSYSRKDVYKRQHQCYSKILCNVWHSVFHIFHFSFHLQ